MEYLESVTKIIKILKNIIGLSVGDYLNYKKILEEKRPILKRKLDRLSDREVDVIAELENVKSFVGKKQKKEVKSWLKNAAQKISEVQDMEQIIDQTGYLSRPQLLRLVEKKITEVDELMEEGRFPEGLFIDALQDREGEILITPLVGQSVKERNLGKIWECLMNDEIISIGVYGMGGIGKTTIVTHIHNQLLESTSTFDHVYWVTVSQESSIHKLQDNIAKELRLHFSEEQDERKRATKLFNELKERKKFVLILDDMWRVFPLETVGIPVGVGAGKLIVTTRSLEVCRGMKCKENIKVDPLSNDEAWDLFMEKLGCETVLTPEVEEIAKSMVEECAGLPLAIITTGGSMRGVDNIREWRNALNELREPTKGLLDMENEVFKPLKFSYDRLNDEKLQQCLLYCALFPEDHKIEREYLIVCWIAEGLIDEMKTRQAEFDRGHALLNKLENNCLLECTTGSYGKICVKMHDVIRDMALNITKVNSQFMVKAGVQLRDLPEAKEWSENLERVSLMHNNMERPLSCISPKCPRLCSLMLQSNHILEEIPSTLFVYMQSLKVLDLSNLSITCLPASISNLKKLRALLLNGCSGLKYIHSLENLDELRELDLRRTGIEEFPPGMEKLVNLRRLDISFAVATAFVFSSGVLPNLCHLQCLRLLLFYITDDAHVEEIVSLRQLEVLAVPFYNLRVFNSYVKTQHWKSLSHYRLSLVTRPSSVHDKVFCRQVYLINCELIGEGEDRLLLPANLQELHLAFCYGFSGLSDISSSLQSARELERCWIELCNGMKHLWSWSVPQLEEESEWCTNANTSSLQSLRVLKLTYADSLEVLFNIQGVGGAPPKCGTFSKLKLFTIGNCPKLKYVFTSGLVKHHLQNLEVIHVYMCSKMENIILAGEQEEIVAAEEDNNSTITCPKLQNLELDDLPNLKSIWRGTLVCHSLQLIEITDCPMLKRLPLSPPPLSLKGISGKQDWWDLLKWDHADAKSVYQPLFEVKEIHYYGTGNVRAGELWDQDVERYKK